MTRLRGGTIHGLMLVCLLRGAGLYAQTLPTVVPAGATGFLTRSDFSLMLSLLDADDPRFTAAGSLTADVDLFSYERGRTNLFIEYEGVLGSERHDFDLNHGNYVLETSASRDVGGVEVAGVFHHVSRHLSDRSRLGSISWNLFGVRASRRWIAEAWTIDGRIDVGYVHEPHFVDYSWVHDLRVAVRRPLGARTEVFAGGHGQLIRIGDQQARSHGPCGARLEAGLRLQGKAGAVELFGAYERRIDAFPTDRTRVRMFAFGFRIFS